MADKRVAVFLADGFEEVEAVTPIDYLRRAGIEVVTVGVGTAEPEGARGIPVKADTVLDQLSGDFDGLILPGGMPGSSNLASSDSVRSLTTEAFRSGRLVASICAAPALALGAFGLLEERSFTCYPGFEDKVNGGKFSEKRVVQDANLITSRGAGTAAEFSLAIITYLLDEEHARAVARAVLLGDS